MKAFVENRRLLMRILVLPRFAMRLALQVDKSWLYPEGLIVANAPTFVGGAGPRGDTTGHRPQTALKVFA
jgi:hypothetical protein